MGDILAIDEPARVWCSLYSVEVDEVVLLNFLEIRFQAPFAES